MNQPAAYHNDHNGNNNNGQNMNNPNFSQDISYAILQYLMFHMRLNNLLILLKVSAPTCCSSKGQQL